MTKHTAIALKPEQPNTESKKAVAGPFFPQANGGNNISVSELNGKDLIISILKREEWQVSDHIKLYLDVGGTIFIGDHWVPKSKIEEIDPEFTFPLTNLHVGKIFITWYTLNNGHESEKVAVSITV